MLRLLVICIRHVRIRDKDIHLVRFLVHSHSYKLSMDHMATGVSVVPSLVNRDLSLECEWIVYSGVISQCAFVCLAVTYMVIGECVMISHLVRQHTIELLYFQCHLRGLKGAIHTTRCLGSQQGSNRWQSVVRMLTPLRRPLAMRQ